MSAQSKPQPFAQAMFGMGLLAGLGIAQLVWLGRGDRIGDLLVTMIGPFIGIVIGLQVAAKQGKEAKPHPMIWHAVFGAIVTVAWLVFVAAIYGGLQANTFAPIVVLSVVGTAMLVAATPLLWPESVNGLTPLQESILAEGLEDLIPLPEIATTVKLRHLVPAGSAIPELSAALLALLDDGKIQVWNGHWSEDPEIVDRETARSLLILEEQYEFNSPTDLVRRVYYVNVDNLKVPEG